MGRVSWFVFFRMLLFNASFQHEAVSMLVRMASVVVLEAVVVFLTLFDR